LLKSNINIYFSYLTPDSGKPCHLYEHFKNENVAKSQKYLTTVGCDCHYIM